MTNIAKVKLTCVDYRVAAVVDRSPGSTAATPGAVVHDGVLKGLEAKLMTLESRGVEYVEIDLLTHSDCGAMKVALSALQGNRALGSVAYDQLVRPLRRELKSAGIDPLAITPADLLMIHHEMQKERLGLFAQQSSCFGFSVRVNAGGPMVVEANAHERSALIVTVPTQQPRRRLIAWSTAFPDVSSWYVLQNPGIAHPRLWPSVIGDMEIAFNLGLTDVVFTARPDSGKKQKDELLLENFRNHLSRGDVVQMHPFISHMRIE